MFTHVLRSAARTTTRKCTPYCATKRSFSNHANPHPNQAGRAPLTIFGVIGTVYFFCGGQDGKLATMQANISLLNRKIDTLNSKIDTLNQIIK